jgi:hypothetical protein
MGRVERSGAGRRAATRHNATTCRHSCESGKPFCFSSQEINMDSRFRGNDDMSSGSKQRAITPEFRSP